MRQEKLYTFQEFVLDVDNACLRYGQERRALRPKAFDMLRYFVERPGQLVTKDELFQALWPNIVVDGATLTGCIRAIRTALNDDAKQPRFIETIPTRGYRFIGVVQGPESRVQSLESGSHSLQSAIRNPQSVIPLVGRDTELMQLHSLLEKARTGQRQVVFVTGEPGIGKTSLVETFLFGVQSRKEFGVRSHEEFGVQNAKLRTENSELPSTSVFIGHGQCIEQYGPGEPYMPILEALGRLCRTPDGEHLVTMLQQYAPTWLVQMPALLPAAEREALQRRTAGGTRERMLREIVEAIDAITVERPLILWLEDLHWSDPSTVEFLSLLARRRELARVLVLGTYRPVEMLAVNHPLKPLTHELYAQRLAIELAVPRLSESAVSDYLSQHFPQSVFPMHLALVLAHRTGGNPLFLTTMVHELVQRHAIVQAEDGTWTLQGALLELEAWTPESVRHVLAKQQDRLGGDEQRVLEAASVAGAEFSAAAVAAALATDTAVIEQQCEQLTERQQFLKRLGVEEWPDGTLAARYGFLHSLYQQLWYEQVSPTHLQQHHLYIGARKEQAYGERVRAIAIELAVRFEQGCDYRRAVQYLQQAAETAIQRSAYHEAIDHLTKGLELLKLLPDSPERRQQALTPRLPWPSTHAYQGLWGARGHRGVHRRSGIVARRRRCDASLADPWRTLACNDCPPTASCTAGIR